MLHNRHATCRAVACALAVHIAALIWGGCSAAEAGQVKLAWNAVERAVSYCIGWGTKSGQYPNMIDAGDALSWTVTGLPDNQTVFLAVYAEDVAQQVGEWSNEVSTAVEPAPPADTQKPVVSITRPEDGATVMRKSTLTIQVSAADNVGVKVVVIKVNGDTLCSDTVSPYGCPWSVPAAGGGRQYRIEATAMDAAGNVGSAPPVTVTAK